MATIAFDVDGTLLHAKTDKPRDEIIDLLKSLSQLPDTSIVVWSGGGADYAQQVCHRIGLDPWVDSYAAKNGDPAEKVAISFDDQEVTLGWINIRV